VNGFKILSRNFPGRTEGSHGELKSSQPSFEPRTSFHSLRFLHRVLSGACDTLIGCCSTATSS
jgi:hypothetical protein